MALFSLGLIFLAVGYYLNKYYFFDLFSPFLFINGLSIFFWNLSYISKISVDKSDFREANLSEADLIGVNLRGADLRGANLSMNKRNSDNITQTHDNETKTKWWQIYIASLFLLALLLLYFQLSDTLNLVKNIIIGGLIFTLILFLGVETPKLIKNSLMKLLNEKQESLITQISQKLEQSVTEAREERKAERQEILQTIAGGKIVQQLTNKMKEKGHKDLELYRFLGLKGEQEDKATFHDPTFQDFDLRGKNQNAVYFLWANTSTDPPSEITAKIDRENKFLTVSFKSYSIGGANVAIRPSGDVARFRENKMRYLAFDLRLRKEVESDSNNVEVGFRVVNGLLQHWHYSAIQNEAYTKAIVKHYCKPTADEPCVGSWVTFSLDLENPELWHLFESDGNYLYGPDSADFEIISSVIFEVGCQETNVECALAPRPGIGEGKIDINNIRISETVQGYLLS